jgi:hypothetical protein
MKIVAAAKMGNIKSYGLGASKCSVMANGGYQAESGWRVKMSENES